MRDKKKTGYNVSFGQLFRRFPKLWKFMREYRMLIWTLLSLLYMFQLSTIFFFGK